MKRLLYILLILSCSTIVSQVFGSANKVSKEVSLSNMEYGFKYQIIVADQTIKINRLESGSYVMIFDASGRNVFKQTVNSGSVSVPVRSRGIFIIRIQNGKEIFTQKILVN